jgi:hypothetical protein
MQSEVLPYPRSDMALEKRENGTFSLNMRGVMKGVEDMKLKKRLIPRLQDSLELYKNQVTVTTCLCY